MTEHSAWNRTRLILVTVIVLLIALLLVLFALFVNLLRPSGLPDSAPAGAADGIQWVRSLYGFGPSADEQLLSPSSVAIAPNGDIYATDPIRARIMVFRSDGIFSRILHTGAGGTGKAQFVRPESIAIADNGDLYIADSWAKKIIVFDSNGVFVREWPVDSMARGVFVTGGRVYVLDVGHVIIFTTHGERLASFGARGRKPGQLDAYQGIVARDGRVFVADSYNKRLQSFTESGAVLWTLPAASLSRSGPATQTPAGDGSGSGQMAEHAWDLPQDLVFDGKGRLVVVDAFRFEIDVVDPKTGKVQSSYGEFGREDGQFFYPTSIAYDARRDWFAVADTQNNRIQIVRIPDSGSDELSGVWRAVSSPYRYLVVPALVLLLAIVFATWTGLRMLKARDLQKEDGTADVDHTIFPIETL